MLFETSALTCWAALSFPRGALPFTSVRKVAEDLKSKVRNEWAYCDFTVWTKSHYDTSFDLMEALVQNLHLSPTVEERILDELKLWSIPHCLTQPLGACNALIHKHIDKMTFWPLGIRIIFILVSRTMDRRWSNADGLVKSLAQRIIILCYSVTNMLQRLLQTWN